MVRPTPEQHVVDGPHGPIGVVRAGSGPPVILIAGLGSTARLWGELPVLLGRDFTVLAPDNRGVGGSREGQAFTFERAADDVVAVMDAFDLPSAALLGVSLGGAIALHAAVAAPSRVRALVVASAAARLSGHGRRTIRLLADLLDHAPPDVVGRSLMTLAFAPPFHTAASAFVRDAAALYGPEPADVPGARAQAAAALAGWDLTGQLPALRMPTLVLAGTRDPLVSVEDTAEIADLIPRATFRAVPDAGHSVLAEGGTEVFQEVVRFLGDH
jgi:pimeloyl-ACP methyl ester carboxylesterase